MLVTTKEAIKVVVDLVGGIAQSEKEPAAVTKGQSKVVERERKEEGTTIAPYVYYLFPHPPVLMIYMQLLHETKLRRIAMVYLRYGIYDSPVPACFIRQTAPTSSDAKKSTPWFPPQSPGTKQKFQPDECMVLILTSEVAEGATGIIHDAKLQVHTSDGYLTGDVVIKLALHPDQKASLLNEYSIYQHLASKHVNGIQTVLGIFDYKGQGPSILIMTHGGTCLHSGQAVSSTTRYDFPF
jgi:hypothetical protein